MTSERRFRKIFPLGVDIMTPKFLQGVLGFVIVFSTIVGGMIAAGICHDLLTRDLDFFYSIWLWVGLIPFWWLMHRTLPAQRLGHPVLAYLALLPFVLLWFLLLVQLLDVVDQKHRRESWWPTVLLVIACLAFPIVVGGAGDAFRRRRTPPPD